MAKQGDGMALLSNVVQFQPKSIFCIECRNTFIFSVGEQEFFRSYGLSNEPRRCPHCRILARMRREGKSVQEVTQLNCVECGEKTTVPFLPRAEKRIACVSCRKKQGTQVNDQKAFTKE